MLGSPTEHRRDLVGVSAFVTPPEQPTLERAEVILGWTRSSVGASRSPSESQHLLDIAIRAVEPPAGFGGCDTGRRHARHAAFDGAPRRFSHSALAARAMASSPTSSRDRAASRICRCRARRGRTSSLYTWLASATASSAYRTLAFICSSLRTTIETVASSIVGRRRRRHQREHRRVLEQLHPIGIGR